jgi:hypothetical protein
VLYCILILGITISLWDSQLTLYIALAQIHVHNDLENNLLPVFVVMIP